MSYLTQMLDLTVQNFLSAATGMAVMVAIARDLDKKSGRTLGNFRADVVRSTLYILLPLSIVFAIVLVAQGVVQTFSPYANAVSLEGHAPQIPLGPAAAQIAIKQLGTNGGGFLGLNSAHPFENPTPLANFPEMLALLPLPSALVDTYGRMVGSAGEIGGVGSKPGDDPHRSWSRLSCHGYLNFRNWTYVFDISG